MLYDHKNVMPRTTLADVDTKEVLLNVVSVDTEAGELTCVHNPIIVNYGTNEIDTFKIRFRRISPIFGGHPFPCLFHCYGRQP